MNISSIFSARNLTLLLFILVVLFLGATFNVGPETFTNDAKEHITTTSAPHKETK